MKELDFFMLLAVFQEMLGSLLWLLLFIIVAGTAAFIALIVRQRGIVARTLVRSQFVGLFGGFLALALMALVSSSGFTDAGGPADWILIVLVYLPGAVGSTVVIYTIVGWFNQIRGRSIPVMDH
ncbi:DUF5368 domain-containing protein [Diaphorobacter sp.]|uniref:DUF5368 domain-containing protein n=1 Tax=Diaphorobacter sp. TaxID=1934310 RepID=UPI0028A61E29|nr:DUF5368 domain-containing protein [Diaphorobacter sp.]